jgi:hypothetical protein
MKKTTVMLLASMFATSAIYAQFRIDKNYPTAGIKATVDSAKATNTVLVDFNTDVVLSTYGVFKKATTQRGVQIKVYNEQGTEVSPVDSKSNNYGSNGNPIHVANIDSIISFYTAKSVPAWSTSHNFWKPVNGIFDIETTDPTNQAIGAYPGMYKEVDYRFYFNFEGYTVNSDIEFDINTLNVGNTAKTAVYKLMVSLGSDKTSRASESKTPDYQETSFYTTGTGLKHVKLAEQFGVSPSVFSNKKIYIALYTTGTGDAINPFKYDPVIAVDNITTVLGLASWITPNVGIAANSGQETNSFGNQSSPVENISHVNDVATFPFDLEMKNRVKALSVAIDTKMAPESLPLRLVGAQSWSGSEWVDITGVTITTPTQDVNGDWGNEKISIPASTGGDEKIRLLLARNVKTADANGDIFNTRLELDNGTRFWYQYYGKFNNSSSSVAAETKPKVAIDVFEKKIVVTNATENVNVTDLKGQTIASVSNVEAASGISVATGTYVVSTGNVTKKLIVK